MPSYTPPSLNRAFFIAMAFLLLCCNTDEDSREPFEENSVTVDAVPADTPFAQSSESSEGEQFERWAEDTIANPQDDPGMWKGAREGVPPTLLEPLQWVIPSNRLPELSAPLQSNNNVDIELFDGRIYMGWRTAPTHFASTDSRMEMMSSDDGGASWRHEATFALDTDVREPRFHQINNQLFFSFFEAGINPIAFEPKAIWRTQLAEDGQWAPLEEESRNGSIVWDVKNRSGMLWRTLYLGDHYSTSDLGGISVRFERSTDGLTWDPVSGDGEVIFGGVSEVAFEFLENGDLIAIGRVEDKDDRGMGSLVCTAPSTSPGEWNCAEKSDPERYDSPELFRYGNRVFLVARRDPNGTFGPEGDFLAYSTRAKRTAVYEVDVEQKTVEHIMDIPGVGDTAFPAVRRLDDHRFLVANYTSPLENPDINWLDAQVSDKGTGIYLSEIQFIQP